MSRVKNKLSHDNGHHCSTVRFVHCPLGCLRPCSSTIHLPNIIAQAQALELFHPATCCPLQTRLRIAHLGDYMSMLVRGEDIVWRSEEMWWSFNNPAYNHPYTPKHSPYISNERTFSSSLQTDWAIISRMKWSYTMSFECSCPLHQQKVTRLGRL